MENEVDVTVAGQTTRQKVKGQLMRPFTGRGKELCDMLRKELGVPDEAKNFEVRFAVDELITVRCEYMPREQA